jgi:hypothetical protein
VWEADESKQGKFSKDSTQIIIYCFAQILENEQVEAPSKPHQPVWSTRIVTVLLAQFHEK